MWQLVKVLQIPSRNGIIYKVASGDSGDSIAAKYSANKEQLIAFNDIWSIWLGCW